MTARFHRGIGAVAFVLALVAGGPARAESVFGLNLVGERFDIGDARTGALGGFVQMLDDSLGVLQYNPAMMAWSKRVTFGVAGYTTTNSNKTEDLSQRINATKISTFAFAFPVYRKSVSVGMGYRGRYDPDGEFRTERTTSEGVPYADVYERSGGIWAVPFTIALDTGRRAKLGAFYSLERGRVEDRWTVDFAGTENKDAASSQERLLEGHGFGAGVSLRPFASLSLGATYEGKIDYDVAVVVINTNSNANTASSEKATMPERWTVSAHWRVAHGVNLYAGASICDFTQFSGLQFPSSRLVREEVAALGIEYRVRRTPLRGSVRYEQLPYTMPGGEKITKVAVAFGSGLLFRSGKGKLDAALQFGSTGSVATNGYSDRSVRFMLSIVGSEEWRRKREDRN